MDLLLNYILDQPDKRLAVYGTLAPGGVNHSVLENIAGSWAEATLPGHIYYDDGLPYFKWDLDAPLVNIQVLESDILPKYWRELDRFEGENYGRIWIVARLADGELSILNIYKGIHRD